MSKKVYFISTFQKGQHFKSRSFLILQTTYEVNLNVNFYSQGEFFGKVFCICYIDLYTPKLLEDAEIQFSMLNLYIKFI